MDTNGQNRQLIFQDAGAHFFGIDVDSQYIYVSDWTKEYVWSQIQSRSIQLNFAMDFFHDPPQSLTRVNFVHQFEVTCPTVSMHIVKVFIFWFFFSVESSGWTKMGLERHPSDPHHSGNLMEYLSTTKGDDSSVHTSKWLSIPVISHRQ